MSFCNIVVLFRRDYREVNLYMLYFMEDEATIPTKETSGIWGTAPGA
ncbi:hypothetical protein [Sphingobacterium haloxyli]|nr:hypothetical protein [Sphingobacterium haloxyli]